MCSEVARKHLLLGVEQLYTQDGLFPSVLDHKTHSLHTGQNGQFWTLRTQNGHSFILRTQDSPPLPQDTRQSHPLRTVPHLKTLDTSTPSGHRTVPHPQDTGQSRTLRTQDVPRLTNHTNLYSSYVLFIMIVYIHDHLISSLLYMHSSSPLCAFITICIIHHMYIIHHHFVHLSLHHYVGHILYHIINHVCLSLHTFTLIIMYISHYKHYEYCQSKHSQ